MMKEIHGRRGWAVLRLAAAVLALAAIDPSRPPALGQTQPSPQSTSDERGRTLDALFRGLKEARSDDEADLLVARIWEVWTRFGRADVDQIMQEGIGFLSISRLGAAHESFSRVIEAAPGFAEAWNKRATVLFLMHDYERSLADIERVLAIEPRHFGALAGRGIIHAQAWS